MKLILESGTTIESPTTADLLQIEGEQFAILSKVQNTYIQCAEEDEPPGEYVLEYQDGSLDQHYNAIDRPITLERVLAAFEQYLNDNRSWMTDFQWELMDLS